MDGGFGFGNQLIFPSGPLRERVSFGAKKADIVVIIGNDKFKCAKRFFKKNKVINAKIVVKNKSSFKDEKLVAFCGIGRPSKFFETLKSEKLKVVKEVGFSDHYNYKESDLNRLVRQAESRDATLITTKKDWVRLSDKYKNEVKYLDVELKIDQVDKNYIKKKLKNLLQGETNA